MNRAALALLLLVGLAGILLPFGWMVSVSFLPESTLFGGAPEAAGGIAFERLTLDHYRALFSERDFWLPIRNSLVVAGSTTLLSLILGVSCAYALARMHFRGKAFLLGLILAIAMFPQMSIVSPLFLMLRRLGLIDTYPGLVLPYVTFAMPLAIWLLVGFFRQLPPDLEEAARVDGASRLRILVEVILPLTAPAVATTAILTFVYCWNEFLFALYFTLGPERQTVPVAIALFRGQYQVPWGQVLAAASVSVAPVAAFVLVFQRRIVQGLTSGAVKG
jgi:ABC-type glycerol-3-phosphate transport system permease component